MLTRIIIVLTMITSLFGCVHNNQSGPIDTLEELQSLNRNSRGTGKPVNVSAIRLIMLKDTAMSVGARGGLALRSRQINRILDRQDRTLDITYNFHRLLLNKNVMPPVLVQAQNTLNLADPNTIRLAQKVYKIVKQARFVTAPPNWREYLWMSYLAPELPDKSLLPKTRDEREVWNHYVASGWRQGIEQANSIFAANMSRLKRDFAGMVLYRKMFEANMVSAPFVAEAELGITGNGSNMRIDDKVLRITALPQLNLQGNTWKAAITPGDARAEDMDVEVTDRSASPDDNS